MSHQHYNRTTDADVLEAGKWNPLHTMTHMQDIIYLMWLLGTRPETASGARNSEIILYFPINFSWQKRCFLAAHICFQCITWQIAPSYFWKFTHF